MKKRKKKQIALFRFRVIYNFVGNTKLPKGAKERLLREKCSLEWESPFSQRTRLSRGAIQPSLSTSPIRIPPLAISSSVSRFLGLSVLKMISSTTSFSRIVHCLPLASLKVLLRIGESHGLTKV